MIIDFFRDVAYLRVKIKDKHYFCIMQIIYTYKCVRRKTVRNEDFWAKDLEISVFIPIFAAE